MFQRSAVGPGDTLRQCDPRRADDGLGDAVQRDHVGGIAHIVIRLHVHDVVVEPALREVLVGGGVAGARLDACRCEIPVVVTHLVGRPTQHAQRNDERGKRDHRHRPSGDNSADLAPNRVCPFLPRLDPADLAPDGEQRRAQGQRGEDGDDHRHRTGRTEGAEVVQMRQAQAQRGARDRNTRPNDHVRHVGDGLVIGRFLVFAFLAGFLISTEVKNRVVRRGAQYQGHQQVGRERGDLDDPLLHEERDDASGRRQRGQHPEQRDQRDRDRPIDNQQQDDDQDDRHDRQLDQARIRGVQGIGRQW